MTPPLSLDPEADLRWLLSAPDLYGPDAGIPRVTRQWRQRMAAADSWLASPEAAATLHGACPLHRRRKLGWYAEDLWLAWLAQRAGDSLHARQPIRYAGTTLGEADAIWNDRGTWRWWELAIRIACWSGAGDGADPATWLGPDLHQRPCLVEKWERLKEHQIPLALAPRTRAVLAAMDIPACAPAAWVCGHLFVPAGREYRLPDIIDPRQQPGMWLPWSQRNRLLPTRRSTRFLPLQKLHLLAPRQLPGDTITGMLSYNEIQQLPADACPLTIAEMINDASGWSEYRRWMLLPDEWGQGAGG